MSDESTLTDRPVSTLTGDEVVEISADASLLDAARLLVEADIGAVLVTGADPGPGIVSERDIVRAVAEGVDPAATTCGSVAHRELVMCDEDATTGEVAEMMMEAWVRHVLVESAGTIVGVVSVRDLVGLLAAPDEGS